MSLRGAAGVSLGLVLIFAVVGNAYTAENLDLVSRARYMLNSITEIKEHLKSKGASPFQLPKYISECSTQISFEFNKVFILRDFRHRHNASVMPVTKISQNMHLLQRRGLPKLFHKKIEKMYEALENLQRLYISDALKLLQSQQQRNDLFNELLNANINKVSCNPQMPINNAEPLDKKNEIIVGEKYYVDLKSVNWYEARNFCKARGMQLATIKNSSQLEAVSSALYNFQINNHSEARHAFWLSASDIGRPAGQFAWVDGTLVDESTWDTRLHPQPDDFSEGEETCVLFISGQSGAVRDYNCSKKARTLCDVPATIVS